MFDSLKTPEVKAPEPVVVEETGPGSEEEEKEPSSEHPFFKGP